LTKNVDYLTSSNIIQFVKRVLYFGIYAIFETPWSHKVVQQHLLGMVGYTMLIL